MMRMNSLSGRARVERQPVLAVDWLSGDWEGWEPPDLCMFAPQ